MRKSVSIMKRKSTQYDHGNTFVFFPYQSYPAFSESYPSSLSYKIMDQMDLDWMLSMYAIVQQNLTWYFYSLR